MTYSNLPCEKATLPGEGVAGGDPQQLSFRVFTWSKLLPMPPGWDGGGRNRKECVDLIYILEVELLGKVHHDRVIKNKTNKQQLLCIPAPVLPYLYGT